MELESGRRKVIKLLQENTGEIIKDDKMDIKSKDIIEKIGLIFYKIILDLVYVFFICQEYGYHLTFKVGFDLVRFVEGWLLYIVLILLLPKRKTITSYYLLMQFVVSIVPMLVIYGLYERSRFFIYLICIAHCIQCVLENLIRIRVANNITILQGKAINKCVIALIIVSVGALTLKQFGLPSFRAFNLAKVYEIRAEKSISGILSYVLFWFFNAILPIVLVGSIINKKKIRFLLCGAFAVFLYMTYAQKSWFFSIFFIIAVYVACKYELYTKVCSVGFPLMVSLCMLCFRFNRNLLVIPSLFVRRVLFVPADIKFAYYEFFYNKDKLFFSEGLIGNIFNMSPKYSKNIALIIGDELGQAGSSCNTGYLADAYANLGTFGVILFALILFAILKFLDSILNKEDFVANFSVLSYSLFTLNDGALLTRLLTGGVALIIVMLVLGKQKRSRGDTEKRITIYPVEKQEMN